ncbi:glycosyltransferase family 4 protein [Niveibacterium sp. COAC-50]|uniref:glycosyltransferase family 4 protein n=1 Tax=Niveibacterium sp. COAC-50 TaxID=2729384 RepID=UPI001556EA32
MKLALVRQRYTAFGGAERFVERAIAALGRDDIEITLLTRRWSGEPASNLRLRKLDPFHIGRTWRDASFARAVQHEIASSDFDLVQSHERVPGCDIYRAGDGSHLGWLTHRARARGQRFDARWCGPYHRYTLAAEAAMFRHPKLRAVICNSRFIQRELMDLFGLPAERLPLIENGVDLQRFRPAGADEKRAARVMFGLPADAAVLAFVGSGFERKGLAAVIETLPNDAHLVVAGKDKSEPHYRRMAQRLGHGNRVHFLGPQQDVSPIYRAADGFVFPAVYEPFGNVVLEAMASGLPTITSPSCGAESLIEHGANGWLADGFDRESLRAALAELMTTVGSPERLAAIASAARRTAEQQTPERMAEALVGLYRRLLGNCLDM